MLLLYGLPTIGGPGWDPFPPLCPSTSKQFRAGISASMIVPQTNPQPSFAPIQSRT